MASEVVSNRGGAPWENGDWEGAVRAALDPDTPLEDLEILLAGPVWVRFAVATNPGASQLLRRLAEDPSPLVRRRVARNPATEPDIRARLTRDSDALVAMAARSE